MMKYMMIIFLALQAYGEEEGMQHYEGRMVPRNIPVAVQMMEGTELSPKGSYYLASFYWKTLNLERALTRYEDAHEYRRLGLLYDRGIGVTRNPYKALAYYQRETESTSGRFNQARLLRMTGNKEEAITLYEGLLDERPNYASVLFNLAQLVKEEDPERAKAYMERLLVSSGYQHISSLLVTVHEGGFFPPMVDYKNPTTYRNIEGYEASLAYYRLPEDHVVRQLFLFAKDLYPQVGNLDYFFNDPYSLSYRPCYHRVTIKDPEDFLGKLLASYHADDVKVKSKIYFNTEYIQAKAALLRRHFGEERVLRAWTVLEETFDPEAFLRSEMIRSETKDSARTATVAQALLMDRLEMIEDPFLFWKSLDSLIWQIIYFKEPESFGVGISKMIHQMKRQWLERVDHPYITLGQAVGVFDPYDEGFPEAVGHGRMFVKDLVQEDIHVLYPRYTTKGLVQMMKRSLLNSKDPNITSMKVIEVAMVDEELRSQYYHSLFMKEAATEYFDPYAENNLEDDSKSGIFGDKTLEVILKRFGYVEE